MIKRRLLFVWVFLGVMAGVPADTAAEPSVKRARVLNRQGMAKYRLGEYDAALELFKKAYETHSDPKILFNLAQTYRKRRDYARALESYRQYLQTLPDAR